MWGGRGAQSRLPMRRPAGMAPAARPALGLCGGRRSAMAPGRACRAQGGRQCRDGRGAQSRLPMRRLTLKAPAARLASGLCGGRGSALASGRACRAQGGRQLMGGRGAQSRLTMRRPAGTTPAARPALGLRVGRGNVLRRRDAIWSSRDAATAAAALRRTARLVQDGPLSGRRRACVAGCGPASGGCRARATSTWRRS